MHLCCYSKTQTEWSLSGRLSCKVLCCHMPTQIRQAETPGACTHTNQRKGPTLAVHITWNTVTQVLEYMLLDHAWRANTVHIPPINPTFSCAQPDCATAKLQPLSFGLAQPCSHNFAFCMVSSPFALQRSDFTTHYNQFPSKESVNLLEGAESNIWIQEAPLSNSTGIPKCDKA